MHYPPPTVVYCEKIKVTRAYLMRPTVSRGDKRPLAWYRYWFS